METAKAGSAAFRTANRAPTPLNLTAAILAGGLGTRLRPAIADKPKVLAPVAGAPFLSRLLSQLSRAGVRDAVLLVGCGADQVREQFGDQQFGVRLRYSVETELLGTGGAIRLALPFISGRSFLLMNGDSYCNVDLQAFAKFHHSHGGSASLTVTWMEDAARFGSVTLGSDDRIARFEEKRQLPSPGWINAGVYLIERDLLEPVPRNSHLSLEKDLLPAWVSRHDTFGFRGGEFIDIGVPESYAQADGFFRTFDGKSSLHTTNR
jgi:D-glycero-alpha-D-manno-heptose 1-phosphate guanylyltransferase